MNLAILKTELQSLGVRFEGLSSSGRRGGAGPAEGITIEFDNTVTSVPCYSSYVASSPFRIVEDKEEHWLWKNGERVTSVTFPKLEGYEEGKTSDGIPFSNIALLHGRDCLASTVIQHCRFDCKFCGINLSLKQGATTKFKTPSQLAEAASAAKLAGIKHITLTSGSFNGAEISYLTRCIFATKEKTSLPIQIQVMPSSNGESVRLLKDAGADTIGIHVESFDPEVLSEMAPAKASLGIKTYLKAWEEAVDIFSPNQVTSYLIVGLGEDDESVLSGVNMLSSLGVYPYVVPFRPIPGTSLEDLRPPSPQRMLRLYQRITPILQKVKLSSSKIKAGCGRCPACSALPDFEAC
jgi:radical SAM protein (TIGR04043 family)